MDLHTITVNSLQVAFWNANSLNYNKRDELAEFAERHEVDVMLICETKLRQHHEDRRIPGFAFYRRDRPTGPGGGVAIYVRNHIKHFFSGSPPEIQFLEATSVTVQTTRGPLKLFACYNRPQTKLRENDLRAIFDGNVPVIAAGDFNAKHQNWNNRVSNSNGRILDAFTETDGVSVMAPVEPTFHSYGTGEPEILDVAVMKNVAHQIWLTAVEDLSSDHNPVLMNVGDERNDEALLRFSTVNWDRFTRHLATNFGPIPRIESEEDLEGAVEHFENRLKEAEAAATRRRVEPRQRRTIPHFIVDLIRQKNRARRIAHRSNAPQDKREANRLQNEVRQALSDFRNQQWNEKVDSFHENQSAFWRMSKVLRTDRCTLPPIHGARGGLVFTDEDKAEAFADSLELQCRPNEADDDDLDRIDRIEEEAREIDEEDPEEPIPPTSPQEVRETIKNLKVRKAPGPDGISHKAIKSLPDKAVVALTTIFNGCFRLRIFPARWKIATVIFIPKPGKDPKFPQNHRPISLLSGLGKISERLIRSRLAQIVQDNEVIPDEQFGFRPGHSSTDQLLRFTEYASVSRSWNMCTAAVFLDIAKAFDSVWHAGLISKLVSAQIPKAFVQFISSFLENRSFRAKIGNALSTPRPLEAGVPQGSVLSPILYAVYTADIPKNARTTLAMYADDTAIITRHHQARHARDILQQHVNQLEKWIVDWRISVNPEKSAALLITTRRKLEATDPEGNISMFDGEIPWVDQVKYLGVVLDKTLSFSKQVDSAVQKGKMVNSKLQPLVGRKSKLSLSCKLRLYKSITRPAMTYASPVWGHVCKSQLSRLQKVQNQFLRQALNAPWYVRNVQLHEEAGLPLLEEFLHEIALRTFTKAAEHPNPLVRAAVDYDERDPHFRFRRPKMALLEN